MDASVGARRGRWRPRGFWVIEAIGAEAFDAGHWDEARRLFVESALSEEFPDFLTLPAYQSVLASER